MGNYWSATAPRVPWDRDGSIATYWPHTNVLTRLSQLNMSFLAGENGDNSASANQTQWGGISTIPAFTGVAVIFPFPRDLQALFAFTTIHPLPGSCQWQLSPNSTNGLDGTWTSVGAVVDSPYVKPYYRQSANMLLLPSNSTTIGVRGVRLFYPNAGNDSLGNQVRALHFYGFPNASATPDRLEFWDPTSNVILAANAFDEGDFPRGTTADITFRIKNLSSTRTANNITLGIECPSDTSPTVLSQYTIGLSGSFSTTQTISSLAPGAISSVFTLRRTTSTTAQLSTWTARLNTTVNSWT